MVIEWWPYVCMVVVAHRLGSHVVTVQGLGAQLVVQGLWLCRCHTEALWNTCTMTMTEALCLHCRRHAGSLGLHCRRAGLQLLPHGAVWPLLHRAQVLQSPTVPDISLSLRGACLTSPLHPHSHCMVSCTSLCLGWRHIRALEGENNKSERREDIHERNRLKHVWLLSCRGSGHAWSLRGVHACMVMLRAMALDPHGHRRAQTWACVVALSLCGHKGPLSGRVIVTRCCRACITIVVWCGLHRGSGPTWLSWRCGSAHMWLLLSSGHVCARSSSPRGSGPVWSSSHRAWGPRCHHRTGALRPCFCHHPVSGHVVVVTCWPCGHVIVVAGGTLAVGPLWPHCHCCAGAVPLCFGHHAQVLWMCCHARAWSPVSCRGGAGLGRVPAPSLSSLIMQGLCGCIVATRALGG